MKNVVLCVLAAVVVAGGYAYFRSRQKPEPIEVGIPIYPGAVTDTDTFATRLSPRDRARLVKAVTYRTPDTTDKVIDFYKEKLKGETKVLETSRRGIRQAVFQTQVDGKPKFLMITYNEDTNQTQILISTIAPPPPPK